RLPATQSLDVPFHTFMRDEAGTIARIYDRARLPLDDAARTRLDSTLAMHRRGRRGQVVYDLAADFGRDPKAIRAPFGFYLDRFPGEAGDSSACPASCSRSPSPSFPCPPPPRRTPSW